MAMATVAVAVFCVALVVEWLFDGSSDAPWRPTELVLVLVIVAALLVAALLSVDAAVRPGL